MQRQILKPAIGFVTRFLTMALHSDDQISIKRYRLGKMQSYEVLVSDFNRIENEAQSVGTHFSFFLACIPVGITILITLVTVPISNWNIKGPFMLLMYACFILGAFFGVSAFRQRRKLGKFMQDIRDSQVPPLGEKGSEIGPSEAENLPSGEGSNPDSDKGESTR